MGEIRIWIPAIWRLGTREDAHPLPGSGLPANKEGSPPTARAIARRPWYPLQGRPTR